MFEHLQKLIGGFGGTGGTVGNDNGKRNRTDRSSSSTLSSHSSVSRSPSAKKHKADLHKLLQPNTYYKVIGIAHLRYIIDTNPKLKCTLLEMNRDKEIVTKQFENLYLSPTTIPRGQNTIYDRYYKGTTIHTVDLSGDDINREILSEDDSELGRSSIINDFHLDFIYVKTDDKSMYSSLIIYKFSAPVYHEYNHDLYTPTEKQFIENEQHVFDKKIEALNVQSYPQKYLEIVEDIKDKIQFIGGSKGYKYRKFLSKQSMSKLQNIAKNKKINYQRKYNGKTIDIKRTTLTDKLCEKYLQMKIR